MSKTNGKRTQGVKHGLRAGHSNTHRAENYVLADRLADALNPDKVPPKPSPVKVFTAEERKALEAKMRKP